MTRGQYIKFTRHALIVLIRTVAMQTGSLHLVGIAAISALIQGRFRLDVTVSAVSVVSAVSAF